MMKKVDKKKIILSVLLSSMLWSNSLYAYELTGVITEDDIKRNENFEKVDLTTILGVKIYQPVNNDELIFSGVNTDVSFTNVKKVENSTIEGNIYGGFVNNNTSDNKIEVVNSTVESIYSSTGYYDVNNNSLILNNTTVNRTASGGYVQYGLDSEKVTANNNSVIVNGGSIHALHGSDVLIIGNQTVSAEAKNNFVEINNYGNIDKVNQISKIIGGLVGSFGTNIDEKAVWDSSNNTVNIKNSCFELTTKVDGFMGGAIQAASGDKFAGIAFANDNFINIESSIIDTKNAPFGIVGGYVSGVTMNDFTGFTEASGNIINIDDSTITGLISGGRNDKGQVIDNHVIINNKSVIEGDVIGGYTGGYAAVGNTIEISGNNTLDKANLYGYKGTTITSDNSLKVEDFNGKIKSVNNFEKLEYSNIEWKNNGTVIEAEITENLINAEVIVSDKNGFKLNSGNLNIGETMTLLHSGNSLGDIKDLENGKDFNTIVGVATAVDGIIEQPDKNNITATIKDVKLADQTNLVASNRAVAAAFVNQGTDLIADSLDTLSRDGKYGVKTFAAVHGNRSKYDVNSDIKINGWSTIVGVGAENEHNGGDFSWGVFYENGSGNYRTYNDFNNEFFRGDGSLVYNGGGIAARYENSHGVYTEGSLRAGMLKSEMTDALSDGENKYGYESETAYYGAHIGVGKIFSLGDDSDLDVYGKFFHTYTEGDSFNVAGDEFEFDSINSDRLRIGARVTSNKENKFSTYYGLAYEYEFNGDAEMRAAGMKAPTQSLQGSSVMAEIGLNYQPTPDSPWSFDLNMRGYAGERQGGSFNVQATYTF